VAAEAKAIGPLGLPRERAGGKPNKPLAQVVGPPPEAAAPLRGGVGESLQPSRSHRATDCDCIFSTEVGFCAAETAKEPVLQRFPVSQQGMGRQKSNRERDRDGNRDREESAMARFYRLPVHAAQGRVQ